MKSSIFGLIVALFLTISSFLHAQTNAPASTAPVPQVSRDPRLAFLTYDQQVQYAEAHQLALAHNADVKAEGMALMTQGESIMSNGSAAEKQAYMEKVDSHRQKLRAAMLKEDPTLEPIFAEIDKHISEMKAQQQAGAAK